MLRRLSFARPNHSREGGQKASFSKKASFGRKKADAAAGVTAAAPAAARTSQDASPHAAAAEAQRLLIAQHEAQVRFEQEMAAETIAVAQADAARADEARVMMAEGKRAEEAGQAEAAAREAAAARAAAAAAREAAQAELEATKQRASRGGSGTVPMLSTPQPALYQVCLLYTSPSPRDS